MRGAAIAVLLALIGAAAAPAPSFYFDPKPRWAEDPDTDVVCEAIRAECTGVLKDGSIDVEWTYDDLYDADGMLVGVRQARSTGCKPLDEHLVLSERHFRQLFTGKGKPDLDDVTAELAPGTPRESVRIVKRGATSVSMSCSE